MGMGRYVVDAVLLEGRGAREVARAHGVSKTWIYELLRRYRAGGYEALEPRSRRPRSCKHETPPAMVKVIAQLRPTSFRASTKRLGCTACRLRCSRTTAPFSQAPPATARSCSSTSLSAWASSSRTHGPITRRPAARSSACTRRSSATSQSSRPRRRSQGFKASSTASSTTTTTSAHTGPFTDARRYRPTAPV